MTEKEMLYKLYVEEDLSLKQITERLKAEFDIDMTTPTISKRLKEYGVPVRGVGRKKKHLKPTGNLDKLFKEE